ncbi:hypothetical protein [Neptunitalea lumnitzerae]|uniref:hypothetical protein n=1 Tax=Neptunitalea lumnitzerae TaxID=2965509 RepID=UPI00249263C4|nr:hypothetical protein [Neptunitalea sp. Y10]
MTFYSCTKENTKKEHSSSNKNHLHTPPLKPVNIYVTASKKGTLQNVDILNYERIYKAHQNNAVEKLTNDTLKITFNQEIPSYKELEIQQEFYKIFIVPEDSLYIHIDNDTIAISGAYESQYNFYNYLNTQQYEYPKFKGNLDAYKKMALDTYKAKLNFLKTYAEENTVSTTFKNYTEAEFFFEYYTNLLLPNGVSGYYKTNGYKKLPGIQEVIHYNTIHHNKNLNLTTYLDSLSIEVFKRPDLFENHYLKKALPHFIKFYFLKEEKFTYSIENFKAEKQFVNKHFDGALNSYLLRRMYIDYYNQNLKKSVSGITFLASELKEYARNNKGKLDVVLSSMYRTKLKKESTIIPNEILDQVLLDITNTQNTLKSIISKTNNSQKEIYLIEDMQKSELIKPINKNGFYLILDTPINKQEAINFKNSDQVYYVNQKTFNSLLKHFKVYYTPYLAIIDNEFILVHGDTVKKENDSLINSIKNKSSK